MRRETAPACLDRPKPNRGARVQLRDQTSPRRSALAGRKRIVAGQMQAIESWLQAPAVDLYRQTSARIDHRSTALCDDQFVIDGIQPIRRAICRKGESTRLREIDRQVFAALERGRTPSAYRNGGVRRS